MTDAEGQSGPDVIVILNEDSGGGVEGAEPEAIEKHFASHGWVARVQLVGSGADMSEAVSSACNTGAGCIVAAGGDGTICGVVSALVGREVELGVIPLGTFNYFARSFDIPQEVAPAIDVICSGSAQPVDVGTVNGKVFLNNASLGLYASILRKREGIYRRWGRSRAAAYWSVLSAMVSVYRPLTMRVTIDGEVLRATSPMIFVAASAYQLDQFEIAGAEAIRNGDFAVLLAPNCGRFHLIWKALLIGFRGVRRDRDFTLLTGKHVVVETQRTSTLVARDGEREQMTNPYDFKIIPGAVRLRVPANSASGESVSS